MLFAYFQASVSFLNSTTSVLNYESYLLEWNSIYYFLRLSISLKLVPFTYKNMTNDAAFVFNYLDDCVVQVNGVESNLLR